MKLNPDCIRNILLAIEESTDFSHYWEYKINVNSFDKLSSYTHEEIVYHIRQCEFSNLIYKVHYYDGGKNIIIQDLTPNGHNFLADIRSDNIWNHTKSVASTVGSFSLNALIQISTGVLTQIINKQLGYY